MKSELAKRTEQATAIVAAPSRTQLSDIEKIGDVTIFGPGTCGGWKAKINIGAGPAQMTISSGRNHESLQDAIDDLIVEFAKAFQS